MTETTIVGLIGGVTTFLAAIASGWFVYRRAVKVDLQKIDNERGDSIAKQWQSYSEKLSKDLEEQDRKLGAQDKKIDEQRDQITKLVSQNLELMESLSEAKRDIAGLKHDNEKKASTIAELGERIVKLEREARS